MTRYLRLGLVLVLAGLTMGCTTPGGKWSAVDSARPTAKVGSFSIAMPVGWMRLGEEDANRILLSRDGVNLQIIEIVCAKGDNAFPRLKRSIPSSVLVSELAELQLAEMRASPGMDNLEVVKNEPATIADKSSYMLHVRYKNARGLRYERIVYGFVEADSYYTLTYQAPTLHYFARDRGQFDDLLRSLHASNKPKST
jgi:hypothetical protein